jgi:CRP/FNR family cyclic AMP-dependent transcriptional regulator
MSNTVGKDSILATLRKGAWFQDIPEPLQRSLVDTANVRDFQAGAMISGEGQPATALWAVLDGQVSVTRQIGDEIYLYHIGGQGFWFGELAALTDMPKTVTFTARTKVVAAAIPKSQLDSLLASEPAWHQPFLRLVVQRQSILMRAMAQSMALSPVERLRIRLADLADLRRMDGFDGDVVDVAISQRELAAMIGVTRQYVGRFLRSLDDEGLIEVSFRSIRIVDSERLRGATRPTGFSALSR